MVTPIRVVIADDDVLLREGLASLLERASGPDTAILVLSAHAEHPDQAGPVRGQRRSPTGLSGHHLPGGPLIP